MLLVEDPTGALIRGIGYPDRANANPVLFGAAEQLFPKGLI